MAGTRIGGLKAAASNRQRYDEKLKDQGGFFAAIGRMGGKKSRGGGFAGMTHEQRVEAGRKGGQASRRTKYE